MTMDPNFSSTKTYHISLPNMLEIHQKKKINSRYDTLFFSEISMGGMELIYSLNVFLKNEEEIKERQRKGKERKEKGRKEGGRQKKGK